MRFLSKKCVLDKAHFAELCRRSENDRILCNCYLDSEFSSKEENIEAFLSFVQSVQHILVVMTVLICYSRILVTKVHWLKRLLRIWRVQMLLFSVLRWGLWLWCCDWLFWIICSIKTNPDKKMFIASYRLLYVIKNIPRTDDNKKFYDELKRVTE